MFDQYRMGFLSLSMCGLAMVSGCGGSEEPTVIQPGEDYQLSEAEQKNLELEQQMRSGQLADEENE